MTIVFVHFYCIVFTHIAQSEGVNLSILGCIYQFLSSPIAHTVAAAIAIAIATVTASVTITIFKYYYYYYYY